MDASVDGIGVLVWFEGVWSARMFSKEDAMSIVLASSVLTGVFALVGLIVLLVVLTCIGKWFGER